MKTMPSLIPALLLAAASTGAATPENAAADPDSSPLRTERALLKEDPARAAEALKAKLAASPQDPWLIYNAGVGSYAAGDFERAEELWHQLSTSPLLPEKLRARVWLQLGNVACRRIQPVMENDPETAIAGLEQSREALRAATGFDPENQTAASNLRFVENELEKLLARLARQLTEEAKREGWAPKAVEKLEAALPRAQKALELNPHSTERQDQKKETAQLLARKLQERAAMAEKTAGERQPEKNAWEKNDAVQHYEQAMADYQQAQSLTPEDQAPREGEQRVREKLAGLFHQTGQQAKNQADGKAEPQPEEALEHYREALDDFQQALNVQPEHAGAQAGGKEVRAAMEQLHLRQGDRQLAEAGRQQEHYPTDAARSVRQAEAHFLEAQALNPSNESIPPRLAAVRALLPDLLSRQGGIQQQQGRQAQREEQHGQAMEQYSSAGESYAQALQHQPQHAEAAQGLEEVRRAMEQLKQQMAGAGKNQEQTPEPGTGQGDEPEPSESFASMLDRVKRQEQERGRRPSSPEGRSWRDKRGKPLRDW